MAPYPEHRQVSSFLCFEQSLKDEENRIKNFYIRFFVMELMDLKKYTIGKTQISISVLKKI